MNIEGINLFDLPVYTDADLLPMLEEDDMAEMVESIKANGQREPITVGRVDGQLVLIDGRNRREACKQAGVEPKYRFFEGDERAIKSFILDTDTRRHNRRAQRAMRLAFMYPETQHGGDRKSDDFKVQICTLILNKRERIDLNMCRFIRYHNEPLARLILKGHPNYTLTKAYEEVKAEVEERQRKAEEERAKLEKLTALRGEFADLASLVDEGRIYLDEALATAEARKHKAAEEARRKKEEEDARLEEEERQKREAERQEAERREARKSTWFDHLSHLLYAESLVSSPAQIELADELKGAWDEFAKKHMFDFKEARRRLLSLQKGLPALIEKFEAMR